MRINVLTHGFKTSTGSTFLLPQVIDNNVQKKNNDQTSTPAAVELIVNHFSKMMSA